MPPALSSLGPVRKTGRPGLLSYAEDLLQRCTEPERLLVSFFLSFVLTAELYRWHFLFQSEAGPSAAAQLIGPHLFWGIGATYVSDVLTGLVLSALVVTMCQAVIQLAASSGRNDRVRSSAAQATLVMIGVTLACDLYVLEERLHAGTVLLAALPPAVYFWLRKRPSDNARSLLLPLLSSVVLGSFAYGLLFSLALWRQSHWSLGTAGRCFGYFAVSGAGLLLALVSGNGCLRLLQALAAIWRRFSGFICALPLLLVFAAAMLAHYRLLEDFGTGLTGALVFQTAFRFRPADLATFSYRSEWLLLCASGLLFWTSYRLYWTWRTPFLCIAGGLLLLAMCLWPLPGPSRAVRQNLAKNPLEFLADDFVSSRLFHPSWHYGQEERLPNDAQLHSLKLIDPAFVTANSEPLDPVLAPPTATRHWNVLMFVLESTGANYIFDTSEGNAVPMPFLQHLAETGLFLKNHYTTAGSSAEAGFSLFTGLYPCGGDWSASSSDIYIPTFNRFLSPDYGSFLMHPTSFSMAFAHQVLVNNGLTNLFDRTLIPVAGEPDRDPSARNEKASIRFLLEKLDAGPRPFFGVYWSFVSHYPYTDYGPEFRLFSRSDDERHRYYNNLRFMDEQIRRVYQHLAETGRLEDTILVFVGDHGEGFGQHFGIWKHGFRNYGEITKTPALFWQPALFPSRQVDRLTSHVDILPTLLDALRLPYDAHLVQGESLFRSSDRKYIFTLAKFEDRLALLGKDGAKVSLSFKTGEGLAYDLSKNPGETVPLPIRNFAAETDALIKFHNYQPRIYSSYNDAARSRTSEPNHPRIAARFHPAAESAAPY